MQITYVPMYTYDDFKYDVPVDKFVYLYSYDVPYDDHLLEQVHSAL